MHPHSVQFFFGLSSIDSHPHPVQMAPREVARIKESGKFDIFIRIIETHRFLLQSAYFDLLRLNFPDGRVVIRRHSPLLPYSFDYTYYV